MPKAKKKFANAHISSMKNVAASMERPWKTG